jgi:hypothetical protein
MKKLLLLTVAITSVMTHAMEISTMITAQTPLGAISQVQDHETTEYHLKNEDITVGFNQTTQRFYGVQHALDHAKYCPNCQPIENQAKVETLFNQYKAAFDATPRENRTAECTIQ